jgi:UDP:flavonoid glycosyltransferase YjiC (YdhE family)
VSPSSNGGSPGNRILFVTTNGTGLGHLTRCMSIARRLDPEVQPLILTLSQAAPVVREAGFHVEYFPSYTTPAAGSHRQWNRRLFTRLMGLIQELRPRVVVFDGAHPYPAVMVAIKFTEGLTWVWCRRPMWKPGVGAIALSRTEAFDHVLEPGEFAESEDHGATVPRRAEAVRVPPSVFCDDDELLPRDEAERELGLDPDRARALIHLGAGKEVTATVARCLELLADQPDVQVAALESNISGDLDVPDGVVHLRERYPMSRLYPAFDFTVSAAGYNAYHELIRFAVPSLYVPMPRQSDDQSARARYAQSSGVGRAVEGPGSEQLEERLSELLVAGARDEMRRRAQELRFPNGAEEAARFLSALALGREYVPATAAATETTGVEAAEAAAGGPVDTRKGGGRTLAGGRGGNAAAATTGGERPLGWRHRPFFSAYMVSRTVFWILPRRAYRYARDRVIHPPMPPPRVVLVALGVGDDVLERELDRVLAESGEERARVLVVTDSEAFGMLRRAGCAFEYLPPPSEIEAHFPGEDYEAFLRRRLGGLLYGRRRPKRIEAVGGVRDGLVETLESGAGRRFLPQRRAPVR